MIRIPQARAFEVAAAVDDWERHNAEALIELACRVPADRPFRAREVNLQLDRVGLARVSGTAHTVARDEVLVASRPLDAIALYATLKGDAVVEFADLAGWSARASCSCATWTGPSNAASGTGWRNWP